MTISEMIEQLTKVRSELGHDAEVRFYAWPTREDDEDELNAEPVIVANHENEASTCSVELYEAE